LIYWKKIKGPAKTANHAKKNKKVLPRVYFVEGFVASLWWQSGINISKKRLC